MGKEKLEIKQPRVFISYSWSSESFKQTIRSYAERLCKAGIDVVLDQWDLLEGQDKFAFMEKTITDPTIDKVLIFSDRFYTNKANERKGGVGTESQLISKDIYDKVDQTKFIPIVCEMEDGDKPILPVFMESRIWLDFSTFESANANWEQLIRVIYGKPSIIKPKIGEPPAFLFETSKTLLPTSDEFSDLKIALLENRPSIPYLRNIFVDKIFNHIDQYRIRTAPTEEHFDDRILTDLRELLPVRDQLVEWLQLEVSLGPVSLKDTLLSFLERLLEFKFRPEDITSYKDIWYEGPSIFLYETFLYLVASLLKFRKYSELSIILNEPLLLPPNRSTYNENHCFYDIFRTTSYALDERNKRLKLNRLSLIADTVRERATLSSITFSKLMEAEAVILFKAIISGRGGWNPHVLFYSHRWSLEYDLFRRAETMEGCKTLCLIAGVPDISVLKSEVTGALKNHPTASYLSWNADISLSSIFNVRNWPSEI
jgi:hypothetical protein